MIHKNLATGSLTKGTTYKTKPHTYPPIEYILLTTTIIQKSLQTFL